MKIKAHQKRAFTRADLIAVIAIVTLLGALTLPLRGDADPDSKTLMCRTGKRQLVRAMHLYSMDWNGLLPPNGDDPTPGKNWVTGNASAFSDGTNTVLLTNPQTSLLANYLDRSPRPFKCPFDLSTIPVGGMRAPRARSIAMNLAVGTDSMNGAQPAPGYWLDGTHGHTANQTYRCFGKLSDMVKPTPANIYVFLDEHPDSVNDGLFGIVGPGANEQRWIDWPAAYHDGGAGFGMADGSVLVHRWLAPATSLNNPPPFPASRLDLQWLSERTTARVIDQP